MSKIKIFTIGFIKKSACVKLRTFQYILDNCYPKMYRSIIHYYGGHHESYCC